MDQLLVGSAERQIFNLEHFGFHPLVTLGRYSYKQAQAGLSTHTHVGCIEICYLERGTQTYSIGDQVYHLKGGDVLINGSNEPHGTNEQPEEIGCLYWLLIDVSSSNNRLLNLTKTETAAINQQLGLIANEQFRGLGGLKKDIDKAFQILEKGDLIGLDRVLLSHYLLGYILKIIKSGQLASTGSVSPQVQKAIDYIEQHFEEQFSIAELADQVGWSEPHLKQIFKNQIGIPPGEYLARTRIKRASEYLLKPDTPIAEVAYKTGFTSQGYFSTVFRKHKGLSPGSYRKNKLNQHE